MGDGGGVPIRPRPVVLPRKGTRMDDGLEGPEFTHSKTMNTYENNTKLYSRTISALQPVFEGELQRGGHL